MSDPIRIPRDAEFTRRFVPRDADCGRWADIEPLFQALLQRPADSPEALERWLLDMGELAACLSEESSRRYIAMTCATGDAEREKRYMEIVEEIRPKSKPYWHELHKAYIANPHRKSLDEERYFVFDRAVRNEVDLYREENIPLTVEEQKLEQEFQKIAGAMTVQFRGEEKTLPQLKPFLEDNDRATRREAWEAEAARRLQDRDRLDEIYDSMIALRGRIARNAGFGDYTEFAFRSMERFDYSPEDCLAFHAAIEQTVVPAVRAIHETRRQRLGLPKLAPWDLSVDPLGRPPLRPFDGAEALQAGCRAVFESVDPGLGRQFARIAEKGLLDLDSRKGKAPGGYQSTLDEARLPFIFMNAAGTDADMYTLLHEGGHAFHALAARGEDFYFYRDAPIEFCEVASMSMELLAAGKLRPFYSEADEARSIRRHLESILMLLPWIARIDAFQHWVYARPGHKPEERRSAWLELGERFGPDLDWSGWEAWRENEWQRQLHLFVCPFYYIEYGIAQLGALQVWRQYERDGAETIANLLKAFALGGSKPLPQLFETAGARFDFSAATLGPLIDKVLETLEAAPE